MPERDSLLRLYDELGNLVAVQIPAGLWRELEPLVEKKIASAANAISENLEEFNALMESWDYRYPYDPAVKCPACGTRAADWREDDPRLFYLKAASLGGMLVFHCNHCGATIRHKYFKNHREVEVSPPSGR